VKPKTRCLDSKPSQADAVPTLQLERALLRVIGAIDAQELLGLPNKVETLDAVCTILAKCLEPTQCTETA
jgi:hypothetical protein